MNSGGTATSYSNPDTQRIKCVRRLAVQFKRPGL